VASVRGGHGGGVDVVERWRVRGDRAWYDATAEGVPRASSHAWYASAPEPDQRAQRVDDIVTSIKE
jgi:hypothetical protein